MFVVSFLIFIFANTYTSHIIPYGIMSRFIILTDSSRIWAYPVLEVLKPSTRLVWWPDWSIYLVVLCIVVGVR